MESPRVKIKEFKASGSMSQNVISEESIMEEVLDTVGEETRSEKGSELGTATIISSDSPRTPLLEISNQQMTDGGSRLKVDKANIANCSLKRIDPSLRSRDANQMEEVTPAREVDSMDDQLGEAEPPDMEMKLDVGGDVPPFS